MSSQAISSYQDLGVYYGDIHNHCALSYGHGSFEEALQNARLQLDFVSVTLHAVWPDIPETDTRLDYLVDFHKEGFQKAYQNWPEYLNQVEFHNEPGQFITFPSYEWHSNQYGDHCIYYKNGLGQPIIEAGDLQTLRADLKKLSTDSLLIPHHIGYKQGYRGINWDTFTNELSPVAEIFSFHGCSEKSEGPYPYLHTMGPRHSQSCAQHGWLKGHCFGVVGSTDHHNAFPGSYGYGRMGVWSQSLTRQGLWEAIKKRRTYALTGDRIALAFSLNGCLMGRICPPNKLRKIEVFVSGGSALDYIDVIHNNQLIYRESPMQHQVDCNHYKVFLELGWGELPQDTAWDVDLAILDGVIKEVEPRFRGFGSQGNPDRNNYAYTDWSQSDLHHVSFHTRTRPNQSLHTSSTEGMSLEIEGDQKTRISAKINGKLYTHTLADLLDGAKTYYLGGFVSPAICFHRVVPQYEYQHQMTFTHEFEPTSRDWYYVRVRQVNNQWAWSSPIWIEKE